MRSEWETLLDVLAGFRPEQVESLAAARDLELVYPLLHALTRGGLGEFFVRVAALEAFIADGRSPLKPQEAFQVLYWLKEPESILKILRESGWMEHEPGGGYRITDAGRFVATVLSFLRHQVKDQALLPTLEGVDYMLRCGVDPVRQLMSRELFRWVMDARGSQDVLERYSSARHRYQDSLQEVHNQRMRCGRTRNWLKSSVKSGGWTSTNLMSNVFPMPSRFRLERNSRRRFRRCVSSNVSFRTCAPK